VHVSYSPSIVTMAVSVAVCEIFSVKEWRDLENQVRGHSRSLKMAPFDRPYNILLVGHCKYSYIYIYCAIFELFDVEQYRDLEIGVKGHSISLKLVPFESLDAVSYPPSIVTVALSIAVCEIFSVKEWRNFENQVRSHSRSLKMAPFDRPCDILMVGYCKYRYMYRL